MKSKASSRFWKAYAKLPEYIRDQAKKSYDLWKENPYHSSLQFKELRKNIYSVRIGRDWRALGVRKEDEILWFWIGSHETYNTLIKNL